MSDRPLRDALREAEQRASQEAARCEEARAQAERNIQDFIRMMNEAGVAPASLEVRQYEDIRAGLFGLRTDRRLKSVQNAGMVGWLGYCYPMGNWDHCTPTYILPDGYVAGYNAEAAGRPQPFGSFHDPWALGMQAQHIIKSRNALIHPPPIVCGHGR